MVINKYLDKTPCVNIMRGTPWGNPFSHIPKSLGKVRVGSRELAVSEFESYLRSWDRSEVFEFLGPLVGRTLGCCCKPSACHGDVFELLINEFKIPHADTPQERLLNLRDKYEALL